jgi:uncharacterized protein
MTMTEALGSTGERGAVQHPRRTPGALCWLSLLVHDVAAAEEFYGTLLGWEFRPQPTATLPGRSVMALLDGREVAGIGQRPPDRPPSASWTPHLASDDVDATAERVRHRGGTVGVGPLDMPGAGRLAVASDPSGAVFGILRAGAACGPGTRVVPGMPVWAELTTFEAELTAKYYADVFGLVARANVTAGPDHLTLHTTDGPVAAVRGMGAGPSRSRGAHWTTYFATADVDAAAQRVGELGGTLTEPPQDGPHGRLATVADPEGAAFVLVRKD